MRLFLWLFFSTQFFSAQLGWLRTSFFARMLCMELIKASGEREPFSEAKLRDSLVRSGAALHVIDSVTQRAVKQVRRIPQTTHLYERVQGALATADPLAAMRYGLKRSIMRLGPSGHPFESYVARVLEGHGYTTVVSALVDGHCVTHEVDVIAEKDGERLMLECKFHNQPGLRSTVKDSLYIHSRFLDVRDKDVANACCVVDLEAGRKALGSTNRFWQEEAFPNEHHPHADRGFTRGGLVTNTKVTLDARAYAACVGLLVIGWRYPEGKGLEQFVEAKRLYPVTIFSELSSSVLQALFLRGTYTIQDLLEVPIQDFVRVTRIRPRQAAQMYDSARRLLEH